MKTIDSILLFAQSYTILTVLTAFAGGFAIGILLKYGIFFKQRRRILKLEDEMLANHSRILSLEKRLSESKIQNGVVIENADIAATSKLGLKAS